LDSSADLMQISSTIKSSFNFNIFVIAPPLVIALTIYRRIPPIPGIFLGVATAVIVALLVQGASPADASRAMMSGYVSDTGFDSVDTLLSKGGLMSMMWVISLVVIALAFGGALEATGSLEAIVRASVARLSTRARLMTGALLISLGFNFASNAFVAYTIPGRMFAPAFKRFNLAPENLSRALEDGATMSAPLIPWNSGGVFVASTLGVPVIAYAPFAIANWTAPLFDLLWAWTGFFTPVLQNQEIQMEENAS
ncbi:MAG: Na+/H+ antiporter NhaC family protein, partial [Pseudomonadota bacterium]